MCVHSQIAVQRLKALLSVFNPPCVASTVIALMIAIVTAELGRLDCSAD